MLRTWEGKDGRFMAWQGGKGRGGERDITAMEEKQRCGNGNRTYCSANKGLLYESVWGGRECQPVPVGKDATARYGLRQDQKKESGKIKL